MLKHHFYTTNQYYIIITIRHSFLLILFNPLQSERCFGVLIQATGFKEMITRQKRVRVRS